MSLPTHYELEHEVLPMIRRDIVDVDDKHVQAALFSLLGLVHDLADELYQRNAS
jgi:hypothetical protein